jgi:hypothetical protein
VSMPAACGLNPNDVMPSSLQAERWAHRTVHSVVRSEQEAA